MAEPSVLQPASRAAGEHPRWAAAVEVVAAADWELVPASVGLAMNRNRAGQKPRDSVAASVHRAAVGAALPAGDSAPAEAAAALALAAASGMVE
ncbi:MAG TPA: hypothetical protein VKU02_09095 [Gemmataceae bacterium]|nr:hypothetical protein [Gemmataceae bacterium]